MPYRMSDVNLPGAILSKMTCFVFLSKASLQKNAVSGGAAGCLKKGRLRICLTKMDIIFLQKKKGKKTGHNYGHPLDRKQTFFY